MGFGSPGMPGHLGQPEIRQNQQHHHARYMLQNSTLSLDPNTLLVSIAILGLLLSLFSFSFSRNWRMQDCGLGAWSKSMLALGCSSLLFYSRGFAPWSMSFLLANLLVISVAPFILVAYSRLFEIEAPARFIRTTSALGIAGVSAHYFFELPRSIAVFTLCVAIAAQLAMVAYVLVRNSTNRANLSTWIACSATGLLAVALTLRALSAAFGDLPSAFVEPKPLPIGLMMVGAIFSVALSVNFFTMVDERHEREAFAHLRRDGLTGLLTRTTFFDLASGFDTIKSAERCAVVMVDIDHFKQINDTFGHKGGDTTLAHLGRLIASSIRLSDLAGRYGGEEFCILLRDCGEEETAEFSARLVSAAAAQQVRLADGRHVKLTVSIGYSVRQASGPSGENFEPLDNAIERADQALYRAKDRGRNQAVSACGPSPSAENLDPAIALS